MFYGTSKTSYAACIYIIALRLIFTGERHHFHLLFVGEVFERFNVPFRNNHQMVKNFSTLKNIIKHTIRDNIHCLCAFYNALVECIAKRAVAFMFVCLSVLSVVFMSFSKVVHCFLEMFADVAKAEIPCRFGLFVRVKNSIRVINVLNLFHVAKNGWTVHTL